MTQIFRTLASVTVWILFLVGCLGLLLSPVVRYVTGDEFSLWAAMGISLIAFMLALVVIKLTRLAE